MYLNKFWSSSIKLVNFQREAVAIIKWSNSMELATTLQDSEPNDHMRYNKTRVFRPVCGVPNFPCGSVFTLATYLAIRWNEKDPRNQKGVHQSVWAASVLCLKIESLYGGSMNVLICKHDSYKHTRRTEHGWFLVPIYVARFLCPHLGTLLCEEQTCVVFSLPDM